VNGVNPVTKFPFAIEIPALGELVLGRFDDIQGEGKWPSSDKPQR